MALKQQLLKLPLGFKGILSDGENLYKIEKVKFTHSEPFYSITNLSDYKNIALFEEKVIRDGYEETILEGYMSCGKIRIKQEADISCLFFSSKNSFKKWTENLSNH